VGEDNDGDRGAPGDENQGVQIYFYFFENPHGMRMGAARRVWNGIGVSRLRSGLRSFTWPKIDG
jgi:hypothetical protein